MDTPILAGTGGIGIPELLLVIVVALFFGAPLVAGTIAHDKGYNFLLGFLVAAMIPVLGFLAVLAAPTRRTTS